MSMKNFSDTIGNQTRDLRACSAVPKKLAQPGAPIKVSKRVKIPKIITNGPKTYLILAVYFALPDLLTLWLSVSNGACIVHGQQKTHIDGGASSNDTVVTCKKGKAIPLQA